MNILRIWDKLGDFIGNTPLHPQYFVIKAERESIKKTISLLKGNVLDIGCGRMLLKKNVLESGHKYISLDHPKIYQRQRALEKPDILADIAKIPLKKESVDSVLLLMVLAHLPNPCLASHEISRITRRGGLLFVSSVENYPAHDLPDDYFRFRSTGINSLFTKNGFKLKECYSWGNLWQVNAVNFNVFLMQNAKKAWDENRNIFLTGLIITTSLPLIFVTNLMAILLTPLDIIKTSKLINFSIFIKK